MAVTVAQLAAALRVGSTTEETAEVTRLLATAQAIVQDKAPTAPEALRDEAVIRIAAHLFDRPNWVEGAGYATILRNSGAGDLLSKWIGIRTAIAGQDSSAASAAPSVPAGTAGLSAAQVQAIVDERLEALIRAPAFKAVTATWPDNKIPGSIARDTEVTSAVGEVRQVPSTAGQAGRVLSVGSDLRAFWDLAVDVLTRAVGSLTGNKGKVVAVNPAEDGFSLIDAGGAATDSTARGLAQQAKTEAGGALTKANSAALQGTANAERLNSADYTLDAFSTAMKQLSGWRFGAFADASAEAGAAGFGIGYWVSGEKPAAYGDVTWNTEHAGLASSTSYFVALRVPSGFPVSADWVRVVPSRGGSDLQFEPSGGDVWLPFALTDTPLHYDIYALYASPTAFVGLELQANDDIRLELSSQTFADPVPALVHDIAQAHSDLDSITTHEIGTAFTDATDADREANAGWAQRAGAEGDFETHHQLYAFPAMARLRDVDFSGSGASIFPILALFSGNDPLAYRIEHKRGGSVIATYPGNDQYFKFADRSPSSAEVYYELASGTSDAPTSVNAREGDIFQIQKTTQVTSLAVGVDDLTAAAVARLLPAPTVGNKGKFAAIKPDGSAWEAVDAPAGGASVTTLSGSVTYSDGNQRKDSGIDLPEDFNVAFVSVRNASLNFGTETITKAEWDKWGNLGPAPGSVNWNTGRTNYASLDDHPNTTALVYLSRNGNSLIVGWNNVNVATLTIDVAVL